MIYDVLKTNLFFKSFYSSKNPRKIGFHNIENDTIFFSCTKSALEWWLCDTKDLNIHNIL